MRLIFMGTPGFAVTTLKALLAAGHEVVCAYTQPARQAGRGMALRPSPVEMLARSRDIEVRTPVTLKTTEEQRRFASLEFDAAVVVAYGLILPKAILDASRLGCFNAHASLLPRWRGAAPIQRAIMAGDGVTGVSIMRMDEGLDTGAVCRSARVAITPRSTAQILHDELAELGARLMVEVLSEEKIICAAQPLDGVTYANKIGKSETRIDFFRPAVEVRNHIHGLSPSPGAWFEAAGSRIKVLACETAAGKGEPGTVLDDHLAIACGDGAVRLLHLQREGKGPMQAEAFLRGTAIAAGTRLA